MINEYTERDISKILYVINDAAVKYRGVIPDEYWNESYMSKQKLIAEFSNDVRMFGYSNEDKLVGVMGIQKLKEVTLIRHAYTLTSYQGTGVGGSLLKFLLDANQNTRILVGTWQEAIWAIRFYRKFGFKLHTKKQTIQLLNKYWKITSRQIANSVVLEKY